MEYLSGLFVSVLILLVGAELARSSFEKILHPEPVAFSALSFAVLGASILMKLWMALFCGGLSRRIGSTVQVIIDSEQGDYYVGRSQYDSPEVDQEILIRPDNKRLIRGCFYRVRIKEAEDYDLYGELLTK